MTLKRFTAPDATIYLVQMFGKLVSIACMFSYGVLPFPAVLCGAFSPRQACVEQARAKEVSRPKCPGCRAGNPRCFPGPKAEPPRRSQGGSPCGSCGCCPAKDPASFPPPPLEPRTVSAKPVTMPDAARCATVARDATPTVLRLGHDPPGGYVSNNDRLAQTAVWLK